jgi:hypothetical protein
MKPSVSPLPLRTNRSSTGTVGETPGLSAKGQPVDPGVGLPLLVEAVAQTNVVVDYL